MFESLDEAVAAIEAEGYDPDVILPLYDLLAEAAAIGVTSKAQDDMVGATIMFGRVSGIFDTMLILGLPVPAASPADIMEIADAILGSEDSEAQTA